ncbi:MAG: hypothetical protein OEY59_12660 [Deltaproteobacteria bacterium]|nr:hypothetical protein [Deltaproteobacteria bacterium]
MSSTRVRKIGGIYKDAGFIKLLKQLNGRAVVVVAIINSTCPECAKLYRFISNLQQGMIHKLPHLVMVYGYNNLPIDMGDDKKSKNTADSTGEKKRLSDSNILDWEEIPEGHGYGIFLTENDILHYRGDFNHDEFSTNVLDNIRRFKSSIRTLAGLPAKRQFMEKKRTGIIIETSNAVQQSQVIEVEDKVKRYQTKIKTPFYFCKGLTQEISLIQKGEIAYKLKGLNIDKFLKKVPK